MAASLRQTPRYLIPHFITEIQQPDPAAPTLPAPRAVPAPPGRSLRAPLVRAPERRLPERHQLPVQRRGGTRLPELGHGPRLLRRLRGAEEVRAGTSPGGAHPLPAQPGPSRLAAPERPSPSGDPHPAAGASRASRLPAVPGVRRVAPILLTLWFIPAVIHCFHLYIPEVRIPKGFVVRSFFSCNQSMNTPPLFCVRQGTQRGNLWIIL